MKRLAFKRIVALVLALATLLSLSAVAGDSAAMASDLMTLVDTAPEETEVLIGSTPEPTAMPEGLVKNPKGVPDDLTLGVKDAYAIDVKKLSKKKKVEFTSESPKIAAVDDEGVITAKRTGVSTVFCKRGKKTLATVVVTVVPAPKKVRLDLKKLTVGVKEGVRLEATLTEGSASTLAWTSSDEGVATVTGDGIVKGKKPGKATISVQTHNRKKARATVTVKNAPKRVTLDEKALALAVGDTHALTATLPEDAASYALTWTSSDASVATVDARGVVTAVGPGTAKITVKTYNRKKAACTVTVRIPETPAPEPTESPTAELTATPEPTDTPEPTGEPTTEPTEEPTGEPSTEPSEEPTGEPTIEPTVTPEPTGEPSASPETTTPAPEPSIEPSPEPTSVLTNPEVIALLTKLNITDDALVGMTGKTVDELNALTQTEVLLLRFSSDNVIWRINNEGNGVIILGCMEQESKIIIADTYCGLPVTGIGSSAFESQASLEEIVFPGTVTRIDDRAFCNCPKLKRINPQNGGADIVLPAGMTTIGYMAFQGDVLIEHIEIPTGVALVSSGAFSGCSALTGVVIPGSVQTIDSEAFKDCTALSDVVLCEGIRKLTWSAFENCTALTEIALPDSLEDISYSAFAGCVNLKTVIARKGTYAYSWAVESGLISLDGLLDVSARLYDGDVTEHGNNIVWDHLSGCTGDLALDVHADKEGAVSASEDWIVLKQTAFAEGNSTVEFHMEGNYTGASREGTITLSNTDGAVAVLIRQLPYLIPELKAPDELIGQESLASTSDGSVILPFADIHLTWETTAGAVKYEVGLETPVLYLHSSDGSIPFASFYQTGSDGSVPFAVRGGNDEGGESFQLGDFTQTQHDTFSVTVKKEMLVPAAEGSHRVFLWVYDEWDHRYSVHYDFTVFDETSSEWEYALNGDANTGEILGAVIRGYKGKATDVVIPDTILGYPVLAIDSNAFWKNTNITGITVPEGVTTIGYRAFYGCGSLESVSLPDSLALIYNDAFRGCVSLKSINLPDSLRSIRKYAFRDCTGLKQVRIPIGMKRINWGVFRGCTGLESITLHDNIIEIKRSAFNECNALQSIDIPKSVTVIGDYAFRECSMLEQITVPAGVTEIGDCAFKGCQALQTVIMSEGVEEIGWGAFKDCAALKTIVWPNTLKWIHGDGFESCKSIERLDLPEGIETIGTDAFERCEALREITLPASLKEIADDAFDGCEKLTTVHATAGTYAYAWAVEHGYIKADTDNRLITQPYIDDGSIVEENGVSVWQGLDGHSTIVKFAVSAQDEWTVEPSTDDIDVSLSSGVDPRQRIEKGAYSVSVSLDSKPDGSGPRILIGICLRRHRTTLHPATIPIPEPNSAGTCRAIGSGKFAAIRVWRGFGFDLDECGRGH